MCSKNLKELRETLCTLWWVRNKKKERPVKNWFSLSCERKTRLELATLTLARLCSTNWAISAKTGEGNETRTHTTILSLPPQSSASTNSAIPPVWVFSYFFKSCPEQDSNLHVFQHSHLKRARLPFRHLGKRWSKIFSFRAENEARTRDPNLGKVMLYQLSYFRKKVVQ